MNPLMYLKVGLFAAVLAIAGYYVNDYYQRGEDIKDKNTEITTLNTKVSEAVSIANDNATIYNDFVFKSQKILDAHLNIIETERKANTVSTSINTRFTKGGRDIGKLAVAKPVLVQNIINKAVKKRLECYELISRGQSDATNEFCPDYFTTNVK